jgi:DNA-binding winged helix-turn-helix (wHTH) protein/tetratricopeptide (TPR) repeat protein
MRDHIRFDGWTLLRSTGELVRGDLRARLQVQPLQVLEELLAHPGELVPREQLIARLWPKGVVVDFDTALNSAVRRLRTALDDHAEHPRYIETLPRRGYRFIGQLEPDPGPGAGNANAQVASPAPPDAAPMPVPLSVPPRHSARLPAARRAWPAAAAFAVGALVVLAAWVANRASDAGSASGSSGTVTVSADARERYERGRFFFDRRGPGDTVRALALFEESLRTDPRFAAAWAGIASVRWIDTMEGRLARAEGLTLTRTAAEQALELDPSNAEALLRLANYHRAAGDPNAGEQLLRRAAVVAPDHPLLLAFRAGNAASEGRYEEAIDLQRRALQQTPLATPARHNLAILLYLAGRYDEARAELEQLDAISRAGELPDVVIGQSLLLTGNHTGALEFAGALPAGVTRAQLEALAYFALGRRTEADDALRQLVAQTMPALSYRVAEVYAFRGDNDAAFHWLQRAAAANGAAMQCVVTECWPADWVPTLPLLRSLHSDPRWPAMRTALVAPSAGTDRS